MSVRYFNKELFDLFNEGHDIKNLFVVTDTNTMLNLDLENPESESDNILTLYDINNRKVKLIMNLSDSSIYLINTDIAREERVGIVYYNTDFNYIGSNIQEKYVDKNFVKYEYVKECAQKYCDILNKDNYIEILQDFSQGLSAFQKNNTNIFNVNVFNKFRILYHYTKNPYSINLTENIKFHYLILYNTDTYKYIIINNPKIEKNAHEEKFFITDESENVSYYIHDITDSSKGLHNYNSNGLNNYIILESKKNDTDTTNWTDVMSSTFKSEYIKQIVEYINYLNGDEDDIAKCDLNFLNYIYNHRINKIRYNFTLIFSDIALKTYIAYSSSNIRAIINKSGEFEIEPLNVIPMLPIILEYEGGTQYFYMETYYQNPLTILSYSYYFNVQTSLHFTVSTNDTYSEEEVFFIEISEKELDQNPYTNIIIMNGNIFNIKNGISQEEFKKQLKECIPNEVHTIDSTNYIYNYVNDEPVLKEYLTEKYKDDARNHFIGQVFVSTTSRPSWNLTLLLKFPEHFDYLIGEYTFNLNHFYSTTLNDTILRETIVHYIVKSNDRYFLTDDAKKRFVNTISRNDFSFGLTDSDGKSILDIVNSYHGHPWRKFFNDKFNGNILFLRELDNTQQTFNGGTYETYASLNFFLEEYGTLACPIITNTNQTTYGGNQIIALAWECDSNDKRHILNIIIDFDEALKDCLNNESTRFIIIDFSLWNKDCKKKDKEERGHSNIIIIDKQEMTIDRYEPNGQSAVTEEFFESNLIDDELETLFISDNTEQLKEKYKEQGQHEDQIETFVNVSNLLRAYEGKTKKNFTYTSPEYMCSTYGLQMYERDMFNSKLPVKDQEKTRDGFCVAWGIYYTHLRLKYRSNTNITRSLLKQAETEIRGYGFNIFINQYCNFIVNLVKKYNIIYNQLNCRKCYLSTKNSNTKSMIMHQSTYEALRYQYNKIFQKI